jgi:hypothetical protein
VAVVQTTVPVPPPVVDTRIISRCRPGESLLVGMSKTTGLALMSSRAPETIVESVVTVPSLVRYCLSEGE